MALILVARFPMFQMFPANIIRDSDDMSVLWIRSRISAFNVAGTLRRKYAERLTICLEVMLRSAKSGA